MPEADGPGRTAGPRGLVPPARDGCSGGGTGRLKGTELVVGGTTAACSARGGFGSGNPVGFVVSRSFSPGFCRDLLISGTGWVFVASGGSEPWTASLPFPSFSSGGSRTGGLLPGPSGARSDFPRGIPLGFRDCGCAPAPS